MDFYQEINSKTDPDFPRNLMFLRLAVPVEEELCFYLLNAAVSLSVPRIPPHNIAIV